jgi:uncharacterized protein (DUF1778 family)
MSTPQGRTEKLDLRVAPDAKRMLQEAARERHTSLSQFVLDSAIAAATDVLAERTRVALNSEDWAAFMAALDAPPGTHPRMERLLTEPSVFD